MIPGTGSHNAAHQASFFYPCWKRPPLFCSKGSEKQEEWEEQEQEHTRRTCTTQRTDMYQDCETHCGGRRCALPPRPPPAFLFLGLLAVLTTAPNKQNHSPDHYHSNNKERVVEYCAPLPRVARTRPTRGAAPSPRAPQPQPCPQPRQKKVLSLAMLQCCRKGTHLQVFHLCFQPPSLPVLP